MFDMKSSRFVCLNRHLMFDIDISTIEIEKCLGKEIICT
jgi:hypothetical protein